MSTEELDIALRNREFEIQLFWQRSNYFLVLITALGVAAFSIDEGVVRILVSLMGVGASWLWYQTNLGSRFWQMYWEGEVQGLAQKHNISSFVKRDDEIMEEMQVNHGNLSGSWLRRWVNQEILKKPSVTYNMIRLSLFSFIFWFFMFLIAAWPGIASVSTYFFEALFGP